MAAGETRSLYIRRRTVRRLTKRPPPRTAPLRAMGGAGHLRDRHLLAFLPTPLDDELLYSVLARWRAAMGIAGSRPIIERCFGAGAASMRTGLPDRLGILAAQLPRSGLTGETLAERHTLLPYLSRFLAPDRHQRLLRQALSAPASVDAESGRAVREHVGTATQRLLFCRECAASDAAAAGVAAWRRAHQLPGAFVCHRHGAALLEGAVTSGVQARLIACQAEDGGREVASHLPPDAALRIARAGAWLLANPAPSPPVGAAQRAMRGLLAEGGWLGPHGLANGALFQAVADRFGQEALDAMGVSLGSKDSKAGAQKGWGRSLRGAGTPLATLLVLDFLGSDPSDLFDRAREETARGRPAAATRQVPRRKYLERHRAALSAAVRGNPGVTRSGLRRLCNTSYCYLSRNDPAWLDANMPPRAPARPPQAGWACRDEVLAEAARRVAAEIRAKDGRPARITYARLAAQMGMRSVLCRRDPRLPKTHAAMREAVETPDQHRRRAAEWAAGRMVALGRPLVWSAFAVAMGLKAGMAAETLHFARELHAGALRTVLDAGSPRNGSETVGIRRTEMGTV